MKREVLFEAVRDEQGDLSLEITGTEIGMYMPVEFWKNLIERFEKATEAEEDPNENFDKEDLNRKAEVAEILKQGVADQEEEEKEEEIP